MRAKETSPASTAMTAIGIVLCVLLTPILAVNCVLLVKGLTNPDEVPSIGGAMPLIVLSDSMYPEIQSGDLIICSTADPGSVKAGDVISFFDPQSSGTSVVTHRVVEVTVQNGEVAWKTKGDANNTDDAALVPANKLVGIYIGTRLAGAGNVAIFMQTPAGLIVCVVLPLVLLIGYDVLRRRMLEKKYDEEAEELKAELEELRRLKAGTAPATAATAAEPQGGGRHARHAK